jgi:hypothetical protein
MTTDQRSVSERAWDQGWAMFETWFKEAVKTRPELDDLDLPDRIQAWADSPEYAAAMTTPPASA